MKKPELNKIIDKETIIHIIGIGKTGLCAVDKMASYVRNAKCIGVEVGPQVAPVTTTTLPLIMLTKPDLDQNLDLAPFMEIIGTPDLIFFVANVEEGLDSILSEIGSAAHERKIPLVLVSPEPLDSEGQPIAVSQQSIKLRTAVDGMIIVSANSLRSQDACIDNTILPDFLIRSAIQVLIDHITQPSMLSIDYEDIIAILKGDGLIRFGIGSASGTDKGISAADQALSALERQGVSLKGIPRLLCNITGSAEMTMDDYNGVSGQIHNAIHDKAIVKMGVTRQDDQEELLGVTIWAAGI